ncbi:MAG: hypothetical protein G3M70_05270 [Candidatus Nitronauta litoralis]|uniref:Lipoprotein n=1 Tax=Candidatus Nitronauta litoralis TaxID=2705533 RepID=A0A7T0BUR4_9BACT|nr:MAG: hypothetical protein G3M70_05270 [Candidatus Nitronauta litoralis]
MKDPNFQAIAKKYFPLAIIVPCLSGCTTARGMRLILKRRIDDRPYPEHPQAF